MRFLTWVACLVAKESSARRRRAPSMPSSSRGTGSSAWGTPLAAAAIASASFASVLEVPGNSSRALFSRLPVM